MDIASFIYGILGGTVFLIIIIIVMFIKHFEKIEYILSKICKGLRFLGTTFKKASIALDIQSRILKASKDISNESSESIPFELKVKWVKETDARTALENNQIIVRMSDKGSKTHNMVYAINEFITRGLMPRTQRYIDNVVMKATKLIVARKIVLTCWNDGLDYFDSEYFDRVISSSEEICEMVNYIKEVDDSGLLFSVLIREFNKAGKKVYPATTDPCLIAESKQFIRFLYNITTKPSGVEVDLQMNGVFFKVSFVLVGKKQIMDIGIRPYCNRAIQHLSEGLETIYILADKMETRFLENLTQTIGENNLNIKDTKKCVYRRKTEDGRRRKGICIMMDTSIDEDLSSLA